MGVPPYASAGVEANARLYHSSEPLKSTSAHDSLSVKGNAQHVMMVQLNEIFLDSLLHITVSLSIVQHLK
jgi:hypothetical protein